MINSIHESFGLGTTTLRVIYVCGLEAMKFTFTFLWENNFALIYMHTMLIVYAYTKYD